MSAPREGKHLAHEAQQFSQKMRDGLVTGQTDNVGVQGGAKAAQLQRKFEAYDSRDDMVNLKMQLMDKDSGMTPFGQVYFSDKDARWLERKQAAAESANYDSWFNREYNKNDLASRQFAQEIHPEFYAAREREMMERVNEVVALKKIQLRGPQSKEDLYKLWLINTGRVVLPKDWDRIGADPTAGMSAAEQQAWSTNQFQSGLVKMPLFQTAGQRSAQAARLRDVQKLPGDPNASVNFFQWGSSALGEDANKKLARPPNTFADLVAGKLTTEHV